MVKFNNSNLSGIVSKPIKRLMSLLLYMPLLILPGIYNFNIDYASVSSDYQITEELSVTNDSDNFSFNCNNIGLSDANTEEGFRVDTNFTTTRIKTTETETFKSLIHRVGYLTNTKAYHSLNIIRDIVVAIRAQSPVLFHQLLI